MSAPPPRANPDLLGHELSEKALMDAQAAGRLHHAWLLTSHRTAARGRGHSLRMRPDRARRSGEREHGRRSGLQYRHRLLLRLGPIAHAAMLAGGGEEGLAGG